MPVSRMAAHRSRTRRAFARALPGRCTSPICAIPTATKSLDSIAFPPDLSRIRIDEGRPERAALFTSSVLQPVAQPNRTALQHLAARQSHRGDRRRYPGIAVARVENARRAPRAIDGGADCQTDLVDQPGPQKGPV